MNPEECDRRLLSALDMQRVKIKRELHDSKPSKARRDELLSMLNTIDAEQAEVVRRVSSRLKEKH